MISRSLRFSEENRATLYYLDMWGREVEFKDEQAEKAGLGLGPQDVNARGLLLFHGWKMKIRLGAAKKSSGMIGRRGQQKVELSPYRCR
jgi:hypothetical protein